MALKDYILGYNKAIREANNQPDTTLNNLDISILCVLLAANKGMRHRAIKMSLIDQIYEPKYKRSLDHLQLLHYIVRTEFHHATYYTITLQGKQTLNNLEDRFKALLSA